MTDCNRCGDCCEVVFLKYAPEELAQVSQSWPEADKKWANEALTPITDEVAKTRLPMVRRLRATWKGAYNCSHFDWEKRVCKVHNSPDKPDTCKGFPWYDEPPTVKRLVALPRCSFWADIFPDVAPEAITSDLVTQAFVEAFTESDFGKPTTPDDSARSVPAR